MRPTFTLSASLLIPAFLQIACSPGGEKEAIPAQPSGTILVRTEAMKHLQGIRFHAYTTAPPSQGYAQVEAFVATVHLQDNQGKDVVFPGGSRVDVQAFIDVDGNALSSMEPRPGPGDLVFPTSSLVVAGDRALMLSPSQMTVLQGTLSGAEGSLRIQVSGLAAGFAGERVGAVSLGTPLKGGVTLTSSGEAAFFLSDESGAITLPGGRIHLVAMFIDRNQNGLLDLGEPCTGVKRITVSGAMVATFSGSELRY